MAYIKKNKVGIFYLIYPYEFANKNLEIYKAGVHENLNFKKWYNRFNNYDYGSEIIIYFKINDLYENENKVKKFFVSSNIKYNKGLEYFTGNLQTIYLQIYDIIKDDIIETYDLDNDIINNRFRKINIYYDDFFNTKYLHYIKNKFDNDNNIFDYSFRSANIRFIIHDYKNEIIKNREEMMENNKIENNEEDEKEMFKEDENIYYICHHCLTYKSQKKHDMKRHLERQKICNARNIISFDEASKLSLSKKFIFDFDTINLQLNDYLYITTNYVESINYIHKNFYVKSILSLINNNNKITNKRNKKKDAFYYTYFNEEKGKFICPDCLSEYLSKQNMQNHLTNEKICKEKQEANICKEKFLNKKEDIII